MKVSFSLSFGLDFGLTGNVLVFLTSTSRLMTLAEL